jgi:hypothetical protein
MSKNVLKMGNHHEVIRHIILTWFLPTAEKNNTLLVNETKKFQIHTITIMSNSVETMVLSKVCLNSKFPLPVELCWKKKSKLGVVITKVGIIIIL